MNTTAYIDRIEAVTDDPAALQALREEVAQDSTLSADDGRVLDGRIRSYLAELTEEADASA